MRRTAAIIPLTLLLGGGLVACGGKDEVVIEATPAALAAAGAATRGSGTARAEITIHEDLSALNLAEPLDLTGDATFDLAEGHFTLSMQVGDMFRKLIGASGGELPSEIAGQLDEPMQLTQIGLDQYQCFALYEAFAGSPCIHIDFAALSGIDGSSGGFSGMNFADPTALLESMGASDAVTEVGTEDLDGISTTHLAGTYTPRQAIAAMPAEQGQDILDALQRQGLGDDYLDSAQPFDVWVDGDSHVRQVEQKVELPNLGTIETTVHFLEFGVDTTIAPPPDFVEATDVPGFSQLLGGG